MSSSNLRSPVKVPRVCAALASATPVHTMESLVTYLRGSGPSLSVNFFKLMLSVNWKVFWL